MTPWTAAHQAFLSFTVSWSLLKLMSIDSVMTFNHLNLYLPLLLLPSIFTIIRVFSNELAVCIRWPKYWIFSFSINPSNKHSGFISFKIDWFDLLAVQGTCKSSPSPQFESIDSWALKLNLNFNKLVNHVPWIWKLCTLLTDIVLSQKELSLVFCNNNGIYELIMISYTSGKSIKFQ